MASKLSILFFRTVDENEVIARAVHLGKLQFHGLERFEPLTKLLQRPPE